MTPSLLDKQEREDNELLKSYTPPKTQAERETTDPEAFKTYVDEAVRYLNKKYPGTVTYDSAKDKYIFNGSTGAFVGGKNTDTSIQGAIDVINDYNKYRFDKRVIKNVTKENKANTTNQATANTQIKQQLASGVTNYNNTVELTNKMAQYFIAAMQLLATRKGQQKAEQYYKVYLQYKSSVANVTNSDELKFISDYIFTNTVQSKGANILDVPTLNAQRKWLSDNKQKYNEAVARNNNITGTKLDKNSGIKSMQDVEKLVKEDK